MKRILAGLCLAWAGAGWAEMVQVGRPFPAYTVQDAFAQTSTLQKATRFVIVASEKDVSGRINEWLTAKGADYLPGRKAEYVSDITPMPSLITEMFARPKMKKLPFKILLARDEAFARTYPSRPGQIALFVLDEQQVLAEIRYFPAPASLEKALGGG